MTTEDHADQDVLENHGWRRLLGAARRRLERTGGVLDGSVSVARPDDAERRVIIGITGRHRPTGVASIRVRLSDIDGALRAAHGEGLLEVLAKRGPLRNRPAERETEARDKTAALDAAALQCPRHCDERWFADWLEQLSSDGTVTRLVRRNEGELFGKAGEVLQRLPAEGLPLSVLAERATGNTKALNGTSLAGIVVRALALWQGVAGASSPAERRALWENAGAIVDDLASQVLVLNVRARESHVVATWLHDAADFGIPFRLTLHQLTLDPVTPRANDIFVCENPAVLRAAAGELVASCATLICTEGQPSAACHALLRGAEGQVRWRGDFDWTGLRTTAMAIDRYAAVPWRMGSGDYATALVSGESEPLKPPPAPSLWDTRLAEAMDASGRAVMEERLIPDLLSDLAR